MIPELVVSDLAGTAVEDPGLVLGAFRAGLAVVRAEADDERLRGLMGVDKREAFARLLGADPHDDRVDAALAAFVDRAVDDARAGRYAPFPGVPGAIARLTGAGVRVAFTTGFGTEILRAITAANGWAEHADRSVASDEVANGRPAPDVVLEAMRRSGVEDPTRVAVLGDTVIDVGCARAAGAGWALAVLTGSGRRDELEAAGGTVVADLPAAVDLLLRSGTA